MRDKIVFALDLGFCRFTHKTEIKKEDFTEEEWADMVLFVEEGTTDDEKKDSYIEMQFDGIYQELVLNHIEMNYYVE